MHIFTTVDELVLHEKTCERKVKSESDVVMEITNNRDDPDKRQPSACYCKYNHEHVYKTLEDRASHE